MVVVAAGERRVGFLVDELIDEQEVIIKSLGGRVRRVGNVSGATILPSGMIALVLNSVNLVRAAARPELGSLLAQAALPEPSNASVSSSSTIR